MQKVITIGIYFTEESQFKNGTAFSENEELKKLLEDGYKIKDKVVGMSQSKTATITFILEK